MKFDKRTLVKWKEDAKNATQGEWIFGSATGNIFLSKTYTPYIAQKLSREDGNHIANACPQNFIALVESYESLLEKFEKYEEALEVYALAENWAENWWGDTMSSIDRGNTAREALGKE